MPHPPNMVPVIESTFGMALTCLLLLVVILASLCFIMNKMVQVYSKIEAKAADVDATPSTKDATKSTSTIDPALVGGKFELPMHAKLAHALAVVVAGVIAVAVAIVLGDGTSVIKLKPVAELPIATNMELRDQGLHWRLDELLGPTYGVGLHHDQAGFTWTQVHAGSTLKTLLQELGTPAVIAAVPSVIATDDLKHPVPFLECNDLQTAGLAAMSLGFIAEVVAVVMLIFHLLVLIGLLPSEIAKPLGALIWAVLSSGFLVVICLAVAVYTADWECDNTFIPHIKLSQHFEYSYGFPFAITGYMSAVLILFVLLFVTSGTDGTAEGVTSLSSPAGSLVKALAGTMSMAVAGAIICIIIMAGNGNFEEEPAPDPNVNPCTGQRPYNAGPGDHYFHNTNCMQEGIVQTLEQAGANVTRGYRGLLDAGSRVPITTSYAEAGLCPVNVHWHLGAEHLSVGQFDEHGTGPGAAHHRALAEDARLGFRCHHYDSHDTKFTTEYNWEHCVGMHVGETYEIHWPHSAAGACGTQYQYQSPFYDGVFCYDGLITIAPLNTYQKIGVQSQVFTIVNDESYYYPDLFQGMRTDGTHGADMAKYTGSTTGTTRNNDVCSRYTPITWQVDRTCHMISASSFDKMCQDMKAQADDMSSDLYAHGSRMLSADNLVANNQQSRQRK